MAGGVDARKATRTSKGGDKLNGDNLVEVHALPNRGGSLRVPATAVGHSLMALSRVMEQGRLRQPSPAVPDPNGSEPRLSVRSAGVGVKCWEESLSASTSKLGKLPLRIEAAGTVEGALMVASPARLDEGLRDRRKGSISFSETASRVSTA